jgi:hypothetical protein
MLSETDSALAIVTLVVLDAAVNTWWGSETPYAQHGYEYASLRKFEIVSSSIVLLFGIVATLLSKKYTPFVAAVVVNLLAIGYYEYEYESANPKGV